MTDKQQAFWSSIPGILTGIAAVITALTGLYLAVNGNSSKQTDAAPTVVTTPIPVEPVITPVTGPAEQPVVEPQPVVTVTPNVTAPTTPRTALKTVNRLPFPETGPLIDCTLFPTVNTVRSLMSWSNHYHQQIIAADGMKRRATDPCNKTIDYRGMAHCKVSNDLEIRQALLETLTLCRAAGIEWQDIQHTTIIQPSSAGSK